MANQNCLVNPDEFAHYHPKKTVNITAGQIKRLTGFVRTLEPDRYMLIYIWRFAFQMEEKVIQHFSKIKNVNGVVEAFRFSCTKYLELEHPVSDTGLKQVFLALMEDYEIVLLSKDGGIGWFSGTQFTQTQALGEALEQQAQENIQRLDAHPPPAKLNKKLSPAQTKKLSQRILLLSSHYGRLLYCHYLQGYDAEKIRSELGVEQVTGTVEYIRQLLSEQILDQGLIHDHSIKEALQLAYYGGQSKKEP